MTARLVRKLWGKNLLLLAVLPFAVALLLAARLPFRLLLLLLFLLLLTAGFVLIGHDIVSFKLWGPHLWVTACKNAPLAGDVPRIRLAPRSVRRGGTPPSRARSVTMDNKQIVADTAPGTQGRAPGLYDEQLQRQQQEKWLFCAKELPPPESPATARRRRALHI